MPTDWLTEVPASGDDTLPRASGSASREDGSMPGTRERLLRAAAKVIQEGGWSTASVAAIAAGAGVAAGTLYRHFPSKAHLFVEVFRAVGRRELGAIYEAVADVDGFTKRFEASAATYARRALRNPRLAWALVYEPVDTMVDAERLAYRREYRDGMARLLREGIAVGAIPQQNADLAAAAVVGVIAETLVAPLSPVDGVNLSEDEVVGAIVSFCCRVVGLERK